MSELDKFRKDKDRLFGKEAESPLTPEQKNEFTSLNYFPENPGLIFHSLKIEQDEANKVIQIKTSAGDTQSYKELGKINFQVSGTDCKLTLYESTEGTGIFLSFRDTTNGSETYHDGRYVEVEVENDKLVDLDFNYAYNPYCAYNNNFRCPITPEENTLPVEINAGEKKFN